MFLILTDLKGESILVNPNMVQTINQLFDGGTSLHFGKDDDYILVQESLETIYDMLRRVNNDRNS